MTHHRSWRATWVFVGIATGLLTLLLSVRATPLAHSEEPASKALAPRMTIHNAKAHSRRALKHRFGNAYRHGIGKKLQCHRQWRTKVKCRVAWGIGDAAFVGTTTPFYHLIGHGWYWNVRYRINVIDEYCIFALHHSPSHCRKLKTGTY